MGKDLNNIYIDDLKDKLIMTLTSIILILIIILFSYRNNLSDRSGIMVNESIIKNGSTIKTNVKLVDHGFKSEETLLSEVLLNIKIARHYHKYTISFDDEYLSINHDFPKISDFEYNNLNLLREYINYLKSAMKLLVTLESGMNLVINHPIYKMYHNKEVTNPEFISEILILADYIIRGIPNTKGGISVNLVKKWFHVVNEDTKSINSMHIVTSSTDRVIFMNYVKIPPEKGIVNLIYHFMMKKFNKFNIYIIYNDEGFPWISFLSKNDVNFNSLSNIDLKVEIDGILKYHTFSRIQCSE